MIIEKIERIDDGEIFSLNENGTYSLEWSKKEWPDHLHHEYTAYRLLTEKEFRIYYDPKTKQPAIKI